MEYPFVESLLHELLHRSPLATSPSVLRSRCGWGDHSEAWGGGGGGGERS